MSSALSVILRSGLTASTLKTEYLHARLLERSRTMTAEPGVCHAIEKFDKHDTPAGWMMSAYLECSVCGERLVSDGTDWSGAIIPSCYCHRCGSRVAEAGTGVGGPGQTFLKLVAGSSTSTSGFGDSDTSPDQ